MKSCFNYLFVILFLLFRLSNATESFATDTIPKLHNPVTVEYLKNNLKKSIPCLVLNSTLKDEIKSGIDNNEVVRNLYRAIKLNTEDVMEEPFLERKMVGRRLLKISREMLYRINMLGMVYAIEKDDRILERINKEVLTVCNFSDWNPSHFLDVAEMSMAVAFALDWTEGDLPKETIETAQNALVEKGIKISWPENGDTLDWVYATNNWNQVCHAGMIAASIAVAEKDPELAAKTISRALDAMPYALASYLPDGVYPEGATYWSYGTSFSVVTAAMLETAFDTSFGLSEYPGFKESAIFRLLMNTPSGMYYNFFDCGDKRSKQGDITLAWFASETGNKAFFEEERFLLPPGEMGKLFRLAGAGLVWVAQFEGKNSTEIPDVWKGDGINPIAIFTGGENDSNGYYLGCKGGKAIINHGNMDAGSFVFELNGVRWVVDPGANRAYHEFEKIGFNLWGRCQDCDRWKLLSKNNFGHSTISVNNQLFVNDGFVPIVSFLKSPKPKVTFDLSPLYGENLKSCTRTFIKEGSNSLVIEDHIIRSDKTELVTWQLLTTAEVELQKGEARLIKDGKELQVEILSHPDLMFSVVSLFPAPLELDLQIEGLKRLELKIPAWILKKEKDTIKVKLTGE